MDILQVVIPPFFFSVCNPTFFCFSVGNPTFFFFQLVIPPFFSWALVENFSQFIKVLLIYQIVLRVSQQSILGNSHSSL